LLVLKLRLSAFKIILMRSDNFNTTSYTMIRDDYSLRPNFVSNSLHCLTHVRSKYTLNLHTDSLIILEGRQEPCPKTDQSTATKPILLKLPLKFVKWHAIRLN
jgi:hypothetical protein